MDDGPNQKAWFYTECPEDDRTNRETKPEPQSVDDAGNQPVENVADNTEDQAGDQVDDETSDNTEEAEEITNANTDDNQNFDLVNVCFEVTRTNAANSQTVRPEKLLLHKGLVETGLEMFDNDNPKTTCIEVWPHVMPRITYSSSDGVSFKFER